MRKFGDKKVFKDTDDIRGGEDFRTVIQRNLDGCTIFIPVIGDRWTGPRRDGSRRIDDEDDFIRIETAMAIKMGIRVIPVFVGEQKPEIGELPDDLQKLNRIQHLRLLPDPHFASHAQVIIDDVARLLRRLTAFKVAVLGIMLSGPVGFLLFFLFLFFAAPRLTSTDDWIAYGDTPGRYVACQRMLHILDISPTVALSTSQEEKFVEDIARVLKRSGELSNREIDQAADYWAVVIRCNRLLVTNPNWRSDLTGMPRLLVMIEDLFGYWTPLFFGLLGLAVWQGLVWAAGRLAMKWALRLGEDGIFAWGMRFGRPF